jgi:ABC-type sugar transport system ATPase subunit
MSTGRCEGRCSVAQLTSRSSSLCGPGPCGGDLDASVELVEGTGSEQHVHLRLEGASDARLIAVVPPDQELRVGERVGLRVRPDRIHAFDEL